MAAEPDKDEYWLSLQRQPALIDFGDSAMVTG
jgi:hypothetical protein